MSASRRTWPDDLARHLLDFLDFLQQFLQLGVGLPEDAHPAEVTDVAVKIATEVSDIAFRPAPAAGSTARGCGWFRR